MVSLAVTRRCVNVGVGPGCLPAFQSLCHSFLHPHPTFQTWKLLASEVTVASLSMRGEKSF